ncbi:MAG: hypothetical protein RH949_00015 [Coleofasciculus sp. A1-SPW-01]
MNKRHPSDVLMLLTHLDKSATINKIVFWRSHHAFPLSWDESIP